MPKHIHNSRAPVSGQHCALGRQSSKPACRTGALSKRQYFLNYKDGRRSTPQELTGVGGGTFFSYTPSVSPSIQSYSFTQKILGNAGGGGKLVIRKEACEILERRQGMWSNSLNEQGFSLQSAVNTHEYIKYPPRTGKVSSEHLDFIQYAQK